MNLQRPPVVMRAPPVSPAHPARQYLLQGAVILVCFSILAVGILPGFFSSETSLLALPLALAAAGFLLFQTGRNTDILNPVRIFGFIWCFCLALASLRFVTINSVWGPAMWTYVLIALLSFMAGFSLMNLIGRRGRPSQTGPNPLAILSSEILPVGFALLLASFCLIVGMLAFAYRYWLVGEIPVLASNISQAGPTFFATGGYWTRPEFDTLPNKIIGLLTLFCRYATYLACIVLFQKREKTRTHKFIAGAVIVLGLAGMGSQGGRGFLVEFAVVAAVLYHYLRRRLHLKQLAIAGVLLILFLSFAGYFRVASGNSGRAYDRAKRMSNLPAGFLWDNLAFGCFTLTGPVETFYRLTQDLPGLRPPSGFLFYSFHRFVPRESIEELATNLYTGDMMATTFLGEFYGDFGFWGVLFGPLVLGVAYGFVYSRALRYDSLYWICVQGILMQLLMYFPHMNFFSRNVNWLWDLITMAWLIRVAKTYRKARVPAISVPRDTASLALSVGRAGYQS